MPSKALIAYKAIRDGVPAKPKSAWRMKSWINHIGKLRQAAKEILDNPEANPQEVLANVYGMTSSERRRTYDGIRADDIYNQIEQDAAVGAFSEGMPDSKGYRVRTEHYTTYKGKPYPKGITKSRIEQKQGKYWREVKGVDDFDSREAAFAGLKSYLQKQSAAPKTDKATKFEVYSNYSQPGSGIIVGKKIATHKYIDLKSGFKTASEARAFIREQQGWLEAELKQKKTIQSVRTRTNNPRIGKDHRNGKDVTPDHFAKAFGFRGVQFGNWVEQGKRQADLNEAYDGLLDLADILGINPKAISLNGELGLAFGARGTRGAKAHYEPGNVVINLTKRDGAGSLAHEWWHALDNHFAKRGDAGYFMTEAGKQNGSVRKAVFEAFTSITKVLKTETQVYGRAKKLDAVKAKDYWSTTEEVTARAFESFVIDKLKAQGASSQYLANVVGEDHYINKDKYPYPTKKEMSVVSKAYRSLFETMGEVETESGVLLFSRQSKINQTPEKHVPVRQLEQYVKSWKKRLQVSNVEVEVLATQAELEARFPGEVEGVVRGAFIKADNTIVLIAENLSSTQEAQKTLAHEILGHYGLHNVLSDGEYKVLIAKIVSSRDKYPELKAIWETVDKNYSDKSLAVRAEEVFAHFVENQPKRGMIKIWWNQVVSLLRKGLRRAGLLPRMEVSPSELDAVLATIARGLKKDNVSRIADGAKHGVSFNRSELEGEGVEVGAIPGEVAQQIKRQPGKIRLNLGKHDKNSRSGYGLLHIEDGHKKQINGLGYDVSEFVADVAQNYDAIYQATAGQLLIAKVGERDNIMFVQLVPGKQKDYYRVNTAFPVKKKFIGKKGFELLWERSEPSTSASSKRSEYAQRPLTRTGRVASTANRHSSVNDSIESDGGETLFNEKIDFTGELHRSKIALDAQMLSKLRDHYRDSGLEDWWRKEFGYGFDRLTQSEARYIFNAKDADKVRNRILEARRARDPRSDARVDEENGYSQNIGPDDKIKFSREASADAGFFDGEAKGDTGFSISDTTLTDKIITALQDKFQSLKKVQAAIKAQGGRVDESNDAYVAEDLFHGKAGEDMRQLDKAYVEPIAKAIAEKNIDRAELDVYLIAKHAQERNEHIASINPKMQDGGSGMDTAKAKGTLADFESQGKTQSMEEVAQLVYKMLAEQRSRLKEFGLETGDLIDAWQDKYQFYVPLKGFAENETDSKGKAYPRVGKAFNIKGKESITAMGRRTQAESPLLHAIKDSSEKIIRSRKNEVGQTFLKMVQDNPDPSLWEVFDSDNPEIHREIVTRTDKATGKKYQEVRESKVPLALLADKYFTTKVDGETKYIKIHDERLHKAMLGLGVEQTNLLTQTVGKVTRVLSSLVTSWNPEFMLSNASRDVQTALYNLMAETDIKGGKAEGEKLVKQMVLDLGKAFIALKEGLVKDNFDGEWGGYLKEYLEAGAKTGYFDMKDIEGQAKELESLIAVQGSDAKSTGKRWLRKVGDFVNNYNDVVENTTRLSTYTNARKAGLSKKKAAELAKNLTVNFNRRGEMGNNLNAGYMFANASIQGSANFARAILTPRDKSESWLSPKRYNLAQKAALGLVGASVLMAQFNREMGGQAEDGEDYWDKLPDHIKDHNFVVMLGGPEPIVKVPMPYGYNLFAVLGVKLDSLMHGKTTIGKASLDMTLSTLGSFSPIGSEGSDDVENAILKTITPTIFKPVAQIVANEKFSGAPIHKESGPYGPEKPDSAQPFKHTWEWAKDLTSWMNDATGGSDFRKGGIDMSPETLQHLIQFAGGGLLSTSLRGVDAATKAAKGDDVRFSDVPFVRKFVGEVSHYGDRNKLYERSDEITMLVKERDSLKGRERFSFIREHRPKIRLHEQSKVAVKSLRELRKRLDAIESNPRISEKMKKRQVEVIEGKMKKVVDKFNLSYNRLDM